MKIISHRGFWRRVSEKNSIPAFHNSFCCGFGTETDLRDYNGQLVISHDPPKGTQLTLDEFIKIFISYDVSLPLAFNIKADGLSGAVSELFGRYSLKSAFVFDMSVPDTRSYLRNNIPVYTRMSDIEPFPVYLDECAGVWLDSFEAIWYSPGLIKRFLRSGKKVCVVSSELHGREHMELWPMLSCLAGEEDLMLCTDFPEMARVYFEV